MVLDSHNGMFWEWDHGSRDKDNAVNPRQIRRHFTKEHSIRDDK